MALSENDAGTSDGVNACCAACQSKGGCAKLLGEGNSDGIGGDSFFERMKRETETEDTLEMAT